MWLGLENNSSKGLKKTNFKIHFFCVHIDPLHSSSLTLHHIFILGNEVSLLSCANAEFVQTSVCQDVALADKVAHYHRHASAACFESLSRTL